MRYEIIKTYIANIKPGDCIMENGVMVTVSSNHIKRDPFLGTTLRGDSYNGGHKSVLNIAVSFTPPDMRLIVAALISPT